MNALILTASLALMSTSAPPEASRQDPPAATLATAPKVSPLTRDTRGRPTIDVQINGRGPFRLVVDTAAQTSLLAPDLIESLGLPAVGEMGIGGVSGQQQSTIYGVDRFETSFFDAQDVGLLALLNANITEAKGIMGMEMFGQDRLMFDNVAQRLESQSSGAAVEGYVSIKGHLNDSGLLEVPVEIDGVAFKALVDTGASVSVASGGALKALGWTAADPRLSAAGAIRGATRHGTAVQQGKVGRVRLGPVTFRDVPLIFVADETEAQGAVATPALILGSDLLNNLDAFALDFPKAELHVRIPK